VHFDFDESAIRAQEHDHLRWNRACFDRIAGTITIEGHCDERGTTAYNLALGNRRAAAAMEFLQVAGVPESRMRTVSYGDTRPLATGSGEPAWSRNRRAAFVAEH
jgi:peptidoglycan-associated lipoprotein